MATPRPRTTRPDASPPRDGRVLATLFEIDARLRDLDQTWKTVAQRLEASRRELAVAAVELQRARSLAARRPRGDDDEQGAAVLPRGEEARHVRLFEEFERALKEAEAQRLAVHEETQGLRQRRRAALRQLSPGVRAPYEAALLAGRAPVVTKVADRSCGACASPLPATVVEAVDRGAVVVCNGCARLLCPSP